MVGRESLDFKQIPLTLDSLPFTMSFAKPKTMPNHSQAHLGVKIVTPGPPCKTMLPLDCRHMSSRQFPHSDNRLDCRQIQSFRSITSSLRRSGGRAIGQSLRSGPASNHDDNRTLGEVPHTH
ncbi:MAG: hypothetical protein M2R45_05320 [Verrucomicrobia subdivision 3 bacterium]|nr:hypothetical protein [Limisphaerales bacterium]MCS1415716.1 hypothetical protein [Limisphaerales bacterium]